MAEILASQREVVISALKQVLHRVVTDVDFWYHMQGTETLAQCIKAYSVLAGVPQEELTSKFNGPFPNNGTDYRRRLPHETELSEKLQGLCKWLDENEIDYPPKYYC